MMDKVAVVILNWNGKAMMGEYLSKVVRLSEEATVIVADNASTDDSVPFLQAKFPEVESHQAQQELGVCRRV